MTRFTTAVRPNKSDKINNLAVIVTHACINNRMKAYGSSALYEIGDDYLLNHQYDIIKNYFPNSEIIATIGYMADRVMRKIKNPIIWVENQLYEDTSPVEDLRLALNITKNDSILVIPGDLFFDSSAIESIIPSSCLLIDIQDQVMNEAGITAGPHYVEGISYGLTPLWTGMFMVQDSMILRKVVANRKFNKLCMFEIVEKLINRGCKFTPVCDETMITVRMNNGKIMGEFDE